ncbi:MAG: HAMP domain-containing sensor histidine kinase [Myxococcota bacterium]
MAAGETPQAVATLPNWLAIEIPPEADALSPRGQQKLLEAARLEVLRRTYNGTFAYPFLLVTLGILNGDFDRSRSVMVAMVAVMCAVVVVRVALYRQAVRDTSTFGWQAHGHLGLGVFSSAALSIYACSVFVGDQGTPGSVAGFVTIAGVAAMVVTIASVRRALALVWIWAALGPVLLATLWLGDTAGYGLAVMFAYFALILTSAVGRAHRAYWDAQLTGARLEEHAKESLALSRIAGMAQIATDVLHNVGNTLNSVKTTTAELSTLHARDPHRDLLRIAETVANPGSLPAGRRSEFAEFAHAVAADAGMRQADVGSELTRLRLHVDHIERVVARHQEIARGAPDARDCCVEELVEAAVDLLGCGAGTRPAGLRVDIASELAVSADRDGALQILVNLIKNALEATAGVADPHVVISASAAADTVTIRVQDNGAGASADTTGRIFSRGYTTKPHGHGFGLHSAKSIANAMDGVVCFDSPGAGLGATVTLTLPRPLALAA